MTTYTLRQVRPLLTSDELSLFQDSRRQSIGQLSVQQLRKAITRTRDLRDKYRDLYRRQTVETRSSRTSEGKTARAHQGGENARTRLKSDVLADVLERFQLRLDKVTDAAGKAMGKKGKAASASPAVSKKAAEDSPAMDIESLKQDVRDALAASLEGHGNPAHDAMEQHTDVSGKAYQAHSDKRGEDKS